MMHELFESQVDRNPEAIALVGEDGYLTYRELEGKANQVAHTLRSLGVGPEVCVGLCTGRSLEMIVGLLGILKAGGAYVPLDPTYPRQRLALMLEEIQAPVVLTRGAVQGALPPNQARVLQLDGDQLLATHPSTRPSRLAAPENLAYVLYTSGSTGRPKGVQIEHRNVSNLAAALVPMLDLSPDSRVLQYASIGFDMSLADLLMAWLSGGSLHLLTVEARLPGPAFVRMLDEQAITHATLPPSLLAALPDAQLPALRVLIAIGEVCPESVVERWSTGRRFINAYGPTEATFCATLFVCTAKGGLPPIGKPLTGYSVHLLDGEMEPVLDDTPAELYIGGAGLSRGYLRRPELTAERFVYHPQIRERLYRTGDIARRRSDGNLEFLGRVDDQVKLRGYRVELGEVEVVLARNPAAQAVVVLVREDVPGDRRLVAYIVCQNGQPLGPSAWHRYAREVLPEYMVPSAFVELPRLPMTAHGGKVDRHALPPPGKDRPPLVTAFRPASTPLEHTLEGLFSQVLGVAPIGLDDDFLELGGDSLRAVSIATRVQDVLGVDLPVHAVLEARTLVGLAEKIEVLRHYPLQRVVLTPVLQRDTLPLSFAQQRLWFLHRLAPKSAVNNLPFVLRLTGPLDVTTLERSLDALVHRHEVLRTTFPLVEDQPVQRIAPVASLSLSRVDLGLVPRTQQEMRLAELCRQELTRPFNLSDGPLVRVHLVSLANTEHALLLAIHHTVCDGTSADVLVRDLAAFYEAFLAGEPPRLPELPVQYADYTIWQRQWLQGESLETGLAFWRHELEGAPRLLELPIDRPRPVSPTFRGAMRAFHIPLATRQCLETIARAEGATPFMVLLAALGALLQRCTGSEDIPVGAPVAGRDRSGLQELIGFFVNTLVLRVRLHGAPTFRELVARVRERNLAAYCHQDVPFERLVEALRPEREAGHQPLFQVMLALQRPPASAATRAGLHLFLTEADIGVAPFDLTWNLWESKDGWDGTLLYSTDLFEPQTIDRLLRDFTALLDAVASAPDHRLAWLEHGGVWDLPPGATLVEMEAALLAQPEVADCVVRLRRPPASRPLRVAYVAFSRAITPGQMLLASLPPSLAPDLIVPVHALPRTGQGQVDEAALQRLEVLDDEALVARGDGQAARSERRVPLRGEAEQTIAAIWRELLGIAEISALDNFFELGGHSLLLAQTASRLEKAFGQELDMLELFRYPTVRALAARIARVTPSEPTGERVEDRARKQRAAHGRHRARRELARKEENND